ncbi:PBP1A family penicillin-binding protein [Niallia sp. 01092]|uniref:PBP1A family penicillin-binding protein n=1 Tax=unclassified Niallia TaxID=2837522 RepID=UPI003FCFD9B0
MAEKYETREERRKRLQSVKKKSTSKKNKNGKQIFKKIFLTLITIGIIGMIGGAITFGIMVKGAPKLDEATLKDSISSTFYDSEGKPIAKVGAVNRDYVDYKDIPDLVKNAFIATEDSRFFKHHGIDPIRLGGAVVANVKEGFGAEGASTITQQVVKNFFFNQPQKTLSRKAQEAWLAIQLERKYSKEEIFEMYVNKIFMSENVSGVKTAADIYFGKSLDELTLPEAALLAGMPQAPNAYNPFNNPERAEKRRNIVLSLMHQHGYISEAEMKEAQKVPVTNTLLTKKERKSTELPYDSFIKEAIAEIEKKYPDINVYTDGLSIQTTINTKAQKYVDKIMYENKIVPFPDEKFQAGITLLDTKTGAILAIGGDRDPKVKFGFNYATEQKRQPGSTIKPILDYGPAIEYLKWGTYHTLEDKPTTYSNGTPIKNWNGKYLGSMTMRSALAQSRNIPALEAFKEVGKDKAKDFAVNLGIPLDDIQEAYSIGGLKNGVTSKELAGAYSAFGNEGVYNEPHAVTSFTLKDGSKINMEPESKVVMQDYTAFLITDMLKDVVNSSYGTGTYANVPGLPVAGKTGTTNYTDKELSEYQIPTSTAVPDAWFAGYTTNFTMAVWTGYETRKNYIDPGMDQKVAQQIFKNVMQYISKDVKTADFTKPASVDTVYIEKGTFPAQLAGSYTPKDQILTEYAVKGNIPSQVSERYNKPSAPTNLSAQYNKDNDEIELSWNYGDKKDAKFAVTVSVNGGAEEQLTETQDTSLKIPKPAPGSNYTFTVKAIKKDQSSDPATASVAVPQQEIEEQPVDDEDEIGDDNTNPEDNQPTDNQDQNNNNGNNPDNNGNGNGDGNGNENGNGNNPDNNNNNGNGNNNPNGSPENNTNSPTNNENNNGDQSTPTNNIDGNTGG